MAELPSGTVTFLFTDLERSTRLWEEHPEAMKSALDRHDEILRAAIADHSGQVVKPTGDGFHAVFVDASEAVDAAVDAQSHLAREQSGAAGELRVRMGLHSGAAEFRGGDYPGTTVNKAARIMGVAHGGQVLVSSATAELVADRLSDGVGLVDIGEHRLRDLSRPERLFQVRASGLRDSFPPLASLDVLPNNLPVSLTRFVGRELEIAAVAKRLAESRLVTLTGTAGCGKTRLALQVGAEVLEQFPDGVWLVELAAVTDPSLVPDAIASTLSIREPTPSDFGLADSGTRAGPARAYDEQLVDHLRARHALVILDNCEHLLDACAPLVERCLLECADLRVLATSREPLGVEGEATRRVPSLSVPTRAELASARQAVDCEAVELFLDRAALRVEGFTPTSGEMVAIGQICARLDGIPLAIELAAARVRVLSPTDIALRLDDQFRFLTGRTRTAVDRHQTLRAALDWSYDLLTEPEQVLLARLSVLAGTFSLASAEAICSDDFLSAHQMLDIIEQLADRSLLETEPATTGVRYRMLESIRQYARDRLTETGNPDTWRARHRDFFIEFALSAQHGLWGSDQGRWVAIVATDLENVRAAIDWSLAQNDAASALRIVTALDNFWMGAPQHEAEGRRLLDQCLATAAPDVPARLRARALSTTSFLAFARDDNERALKTGLEALALWRETGNARGTGLVLAQLALVAGRLNRRDDARTYSDEAVALGRETAFDPLLGVALMASGSIAFTRGDFDTARAAAREVLATRDRQLPINIAQVLTLLGNLNFAEAAYLAAEDLFREAADIGSVEDLPLVGAALRGLAATATALGEPAKARQIRADAIDQMRAFELSEGPPEAFWLDVLVDIELAEGNVAEADRVLRNGVELLDLSFSGMSAAYLVVFATIELTRGNAERAATLLGASDALREHLGIAVVALERPAPGDVIATARVQLSDEAFAAAWAIGRSLSRDQAIEYALGNG